MRVRLALTSPTLYRLTNNLNAPISAAGIALAPLGPSEAEVLQSYETKLRSLRLDLNASTHHALVFTTGIPQLSSDETRYIQRAEFTVLSTDTPSASST